MKRLTKCWDFLRTRLGSHTKKQSNVATHCQSWMLSSRSDSRLARKCTHVSHVHRGRTLEKFEGAYDQCCSGDKCDGTNGTIRKGRSLKSSFYACHYCSVISCPKCIRTMWGQSEQLGIEERKQQMFICRSCSSKLCEKNHAMTCTECNSVQHFKLDLQRMNLVVQKSSADATAKKRVFIMTNRLCRNIDLYIGHVVREKCQNSFWPDKLQWMAENGITNEAMVLSDFWKLFEGTYHRRVNCDTGDRQSVETHVVWSVCPPEETLDAEDLLHLPEDVLARQRAGETVFLVTQYHQFSDLTALSAHQANCNLLSLLEVHLKRHKWIKGVWRQTDNCHTYESTKTTVTTHTPPHARTTTHARTRTHTTHALTTTTHHHTSPPRAHTTTTHTHTLHTQHM